MATDVQAPAAAHRVAIMDDELGPARFSQLPDAIRDILSDPNAPELEQIWQLAASKDLVPEFTDLPPAALQQQVETEHFVNEVILRPEFVPQFPETFLAALAPFLALRQQVADLKQAVETAFPSPAFVVKTFPHRPTPAAELLDFDFLIMDLVMDNTDPITSVTKYLKDLSDTAGDLKHIPPILLVSQRTDHLDEKRLSFRTSGEISAAGLSILSKQTIRSKDFGAEGLKLLWDQMQRQIDAAHQMRVLGRAWSKALDFAKTLTMQTLWNLDAAALQQIHQTARTDNDPFEEHLHEIVSHEHLWHLERQPPLRASIAALGEVYSNEYVIEEKPKDDKPKEEKPKEKLGYRYVVHATADMATLRQVERHFAWSGVEPTLDLATFKPAELNRALPLGTVLAPFKYSTHKKPEVLVHLTQECDLNKSDLIKRDTSLFFARAAVVEPGIPPERGLRAVKGFVFNDADTDLHVDPAQLIAIPVQRLLLWKRRWRIAGRVRREIARQLLQASTNNATRAAAFKTTGSEHTHARVGIRFGAAAVDVWYGAEGEGKSYKDSSPVLVSTFASTERVHFLDDESFKLTLWLKRQLAAQNLAPLLIDASVVCKELRLGIELKNDKPLGSLTYSAGRHAKDTVEPWLSKIKVGAGNVRVIISVNSNDEE